MKILNNDNAYNNWKDVGVHPTPSGLLDEFADFVRHQFRKNGFASNTIKILDIFCGDGRIGTAVRWKLMSDQVKSKITFVEVMKNTLDKIQESPDFEIINKNVFSYNANKKFDLVVSNPPYLVLNSNSANELGINWNSARRYSKNLYALSILKGLDLCKEEGMLCVIAPFGYLRGYFSSEFKQEIEKSCKKVIIKANETRTLFEGVNQDVGFQCFVKRSNDPEFEKTEWQFGYNGHPVKKIVQQQLKSKTGQKGLFKTNRVRVGPIVWNRSKNNLRGSATKNRCIVIYGSNIRSDNTLDFKIDRLKKRQFIDNDSILETDVIQKPAIIFRRTMRGNPGAWIVDSAIISETDKSKYVAENHTIVIELGGCDDKKLEIINKEIKGRIQNYYYISGSPTISTKIVKQIVESI